MTRTELRDLIRKRLGETTEAFWTDVELNTWINDGCQDLAFRTKCLRTSGLLTTITDQAEYTPTTTFSTIISVFEVYLYTDGSSWDKLQATNRTELDINFPGWKSASSGTPSHYYFDREENVLGFYVKPNASNAGTDYARVHYAYNHTDLTSDSASPTLPSHLHLAVIDYVVALGFDTRGWGDKANDAWQKYYSRIHDYVVERDREREDEDIVMKNYRNI